MTAVAASSLPASGASTAVVVSLDVASSIVISNACTSVAATRLGVVQPDQKSTTATGVGVCSMGFQSNNDTAMLRVAQRDGEAATPAMGSVDPSWVSQYTGTSRELWAFDASGSQYAMGVLAGDVRNTNDSGTTWTDQNISGGDYLNDIAVDPGDQNRWWAVGRNRRISTTVNGTAASPTWTTDLVAPSTTLAAAGWPAAIEISSVAAAGGAVWIVGEDRWIARSTDNGATWNAYQHADLDLTRIIKVSASSANDVIFATESNSGYHILVSSTGGTNSASWTDIYQTWTSLSDVALSAPNRAYLVLMDGVMTWDGAIWTNRRLMTGTGIERTWAVDSPPSSPNVAYVVGEAGYTYRTADAGATWTLQTANTGSSLFSVAAPSAATAWTAGGSTTAMSTTDSGTTWVQEYVEPGKEALQSIDSDPVDGRIALAVGSRGVIRRTANGGTVWATIPSGTTATLRSVSMGTSLVGWAVGDSGTILITRDRGLTWTPQTTGTTQLNSVAALDDVTAYAVGEGGLMLKTTNGGASWNSVPTGTTGPLKGLAVTPNRLWIGGVDALVRTSSDGGQTWTTGTVPDTWQALRSIAPIDDTTAYIGFDYAELWKTTDGGLNWVTVNHTAYNSRSVGVLGDRVIVGAWGNTPQSGNGGASFVTSWHGGGLTTDVEMIGEHDAYIVSENGSIWRGSAATGAMSIVSDYANGPTDWNSASSTSMFGVCLQAVGVTTTAVWTLDTMNVSGRCEQLDTDPWYAVPAAATKIARTTSVGDTGSVDLVWGFRPKATQIAGQYSAAVVFEALAPNV